MKLTCHLSTLAFAAVVALGGCGNSQSGSSSSGAASDPGMDDIEVTSPEEAQVEAEATIDADNADEVFDELQKEIDAETGGGG